MRAPLSSFGLLLTIGGVFAPANVDLKLDQCGCVAVLQAGHVAIALG